MGALQQRFGPSAERRVALGDMGQRRSRAGDQQLAKISGASLSDAKKLRSAAGGELTWDQAQPRRRSRPCSKVSPLPIAAINAEAMVGPTPGMDANRRASSFSFVHRMNSVSKAAIR